MRFKQIIAVKKLRGKDNCLLNAALRGQQRFFMGRGGGLLERLENARPEGAMLKEGNEQERAVAGKRGP